MRPILAQLENGQPRARAGGVGEHAPSVRGDANSRDYRTRTERRRRPCVCRRDHARPGPSQFLHAFHSAANPAHPGGAALTGGSIPRARARTVVLNSRTSCVRTSCCASCSKLGCCGRASCRPSRSGGASRTLARPRHLPPVKRAGYPSHRPTPALVFTKANGLAVFCSTTTRTPQALLRLRRSRGSCTLSRARYARSGVKDSLCAQRLRVSSSSPPRSVPRDQAPSRLGPSTRGAGVSADGPRACP